MLLKHRKISPPLELLNTVIAMVDGHPQSIMVASFFIAQVGVARVLANPIELRNILSARTAQILDNISLSPVQEKVLLTFREYEVLSAEDLITVLEPISANEIGQSVAYLQDFGIVEAEVDNLRMAPFLMDTAGRHRFQTDVPKFLADVRTKMLERVGDFVDSDVIKIQTIDSAVLSALREDTELTNPLLTRALLPSHLLRVAREHYDKKRYAQSSRLAKRAYAGNSKLSPEAKIEALRIEALSYIHHGNQVADYEAAHDELISLNLRAATRIAHFVSGVKAKADGDMVSAETQFLAALNISGERSFQILRQLAGIYVLNEQFVEAEKFARLAVEVAPTNPYVLDVLVRVLIEINRNNHSYLTGERYFNDLLDKLGGVRKVQ